MPPSDTTELSSIIPTLITRPEFLIIFLRHNTLDPQKILETQNWMEFIYTYLRQKAEVSLYLPQTKDWSSSIPNLDIRLKFLNIYLWHKTEVPQYLHPTNYYIVTHCLPTFKTPPQIQYYTPDSICRQDIAHIIYIYRIFSNCKGVGKLFRKKIQHVIKNTHHNLEMERQPTIETL